MIGRDCGSRIPAVLVISALLISTASAPAHAADSPKKFKASAIMIEVVDGGDEVGLRRVRGEMVVRRSESELDRQQWQAVTCRGGHEDSRDVERIEDLCRLVPVARSHQEVHVESRAVADRLPAAQEIAQLGERALFAGGPSQLLLLDARQAQDGFGNRPSRIDQALHRRGHTIGRKGDRADLYDSVAARIETCRLEV